MLSNKALKEKVFNKHKEEPEVMPKSDAMAILGYLDKVKTKYPVVDGGHDKESVKSDILNYFPKCKEYFLMHDINYHGVKDALEELNLNIKVISDSGGNTGVGLLEKI